MPVQPQQQGHALRRLLMVLDHEDPKGGPVVRAFRYSEGRWHGTVLPCLLDLRCNYGLTTQRPAARLLRCRPITASMSRAAGPREETEKLGQPTLPVLVSSVP